MNTGIVVLGHGSRASLGDANQVMFQVAEQVKVKAGHDLVETAIMNRMSKSQCLEEAVEKLIARGAATITVAPMFFANGMHVQSDIPEEIAAIQAKHPGVVIKIANHIGADSRIADILLDRVREVG